MPDTAALPTMLLVSWSPGARAMVSTWPTACSREVSAPFCTARAGMETRAITDSSRRVPAWMAVVATTTWVSRRSPLKKAVTARNTPATNTRRMTSVLLLFNLVAPFSV